jgi:TIR domain
MPKRPAQFKANRSLGEHIGNKLFLLALVGVIVWLLRLALHYVLLASSNLLPSLRTQVSISAESESATRRSDQSFSSAAKKELRRPFWQRLVDAFFGYDFFIAYSQGDGKAYAGDLARRLKNRGFECFLDTEDFAKGDDWKSVGAWALKRTSRLVLVGSPKALESKPVLREVQIFSQTHKRIIPIDFDGSLSFIGLP